MKNIEKRINEIKCSQNSQSKSACLNKNCTNFAFTCGDKSCQCRKSHQYCFMIETQTMMLNFTSKVITNEILSKTINEQFKKIYDQISKCKNKILNDIAAYFQFYGLSDNQKKVMKSLDSGKAQEITGSQIWAACTSEESKKVNALDGLIEKLNGFLVKYQKAAGKFFVNFSTTMKDFYNKRETPIVSVVAPTKVEQKQIKVEKKVQIVEPQQELDRRYTQTRRDNANTNYGRTSQRVENNLQKETTNRRQEGRGYDRGYGRGNERVNQRGNDRGNERGYERKEEKREDRRVDNRRPQRPQRRQDPKERTRRRRYQGDTQY